MARDQGRHRVGRRTKIATGALGLVIAVGAIVVSTTAGDAGQAHADSVDKSLFVDIMTVKPNVAKPSNNRRASTGTFTVNCGKNENGHFNPDNFIAQPGVKNGAQHLHDYVGNLSTNADSNNKSLEAAGTTCKNGDKSAYYWPVLRIDTGQGEAAAAAANPDVAPPDAARAQAAQAAAQPTVVCPDVASALPDVPDPAMDAVNGQLDALDAQNADANQKIAGAANQAAPSDTATATPSDTAAPSDTASAAPSGTATPSDTTSATPSDTSASTPPAAADATVLNPLKDQRKASIDKIKNAMAQAGATPDAAAMDQLATCAVKDKSAGGLDNGSQNSDSTPAPAVLPPADGAAELPGNDGVIQEPANVQLTYRGSAVGNVSAMPKFLRVLYGDAKVSVNGPANAKASFTCTGFENRVLIDKYPICPEGSKVKRIHTFPSCWDGKNIDSANHRTHIVFPDANGKCGKGFRAVPQLQISLTYDIPRDIQVAGQYKVDSFPDEHHNPLSDHDDFANVMSQRIMNRVVNCVNRGRTCRE
jgi:hypothetical protein